jgi:hypothetical protein
MGKISERRRWVMIDLARLEQRLTDDPVLHEQFSTDPVGVLRREGLILSQTQAMELRATVERAKTGAQGSPGPLGAVGRQVGIPIRWR